MFLLGRHIPYNLNSASFKNFDLLILLQASPQMRKPISDILCYITHPANIPCANRSTYQNAFYKVLNFSPFLHDRLGSCHIEKSFLIIKHMTFKARDRWSNNFAAE